METAKLIELEIDKYIFVIIKQKINIRENLYV